MASDDIWPAVQALAATWSASPVVDTFLEHHPARDKSDNAVVEALKNMQAGWNVLTETPLWTGMWEKLAQQTPQVQLTGEVLGYLRAIAPLGQALESTVWWVRSRLPLYPGIPVPQFSPRGYRRSPEFSMRMPWAQPALQASLQAEQTPPFVARLLRLDEDEVLSSARNLVSAMIDSAEWQRYADLAAALTDQDREVLDAARHRVGVLLNPRRVDEYEDARNERRNAFRREHVAEVVADLDGRPRELADAFDGIDDLIDLALVNIHGQLVVRGDVPMIAPIDLDLDGQQVSFDYIGDESFGVGESVRLDDPMAAGAYRIDSMKFSFGQFEASRMSFTAQSLPGTENAFQPS